MKEIFKTKTVSLYWGEAEDILNCLPSESIDVIYADPPYNLSNGGTTCHAGKRVSVHKGAWDQSKGIEADFSFHMKWIEACRRVLKSTGTIWISGTYHNIFSCGFALLSQGWHILNDIIWFKPNAAPNLACRMFTASHETIIWAKKEKSSKHYFDYEAMKNGNWQNDFLKNPGKQMRSVWAVGPPSSSEKKYGKHPTQKPVALMERIIKASCPPNGTLLDPFCGSATSGVGAIKQHRKYVGIDFSKEFLDILAKPRLKEALENEALWNEEMP